MGREKIEKNQYEQLKEEEKSCSKFAGTLRRLLVGQQKVQAAINRALVACTYFQVIECLNIIVLFAFFSTTNSIVYSIIVSALSFVLFLIEMIPRISKKHLIFYITSILQGVALIGLLISFKFIIENYIVFAGYCEEILDYYQGEQNWTQMSSMCSQVQLVFQIELTVEASLTVGKIIHFGLMVKAYQVAKEKHDQEEKKKRRKDRYNQMLRKRYIYDEKRKV